MNLHARGTIKVAAVALGCAKNRVDTEEILGLLGRHRFTIAAAPEDADIVVVNTCSFIESAQQESIDAILQAARPSTGSRPIVIAAGCLVQHYGEALLQKIPELSGIIGVHSYKELLPFINRCLAGQREALILPPEKNYSSLGPRLLTTPAHSVYVKIAEGCSNRCRYCLIPTMRGRSRSRNPQEIIDEVKELVGGGAQEINLVAQDTTAYGLDLTGAPDLAGLLKMLLRAVPQLPWLRVLYAYPSRVSDALIDLIADRPQLCKYLDLPLQHAHSEILERMGRRYGTAEIEALIVKLRQRIPGLALRATYMTGFPGERRRHFQELLRFMQRHPLERVGAFAYSPQEGTAAASLDHPVPARVREKRRRQLMLLQKNISLALNRKLIGRRMTLLVDRVIENTPHGTLYYGRTQYQAPEVDGGVYFKTASVLKPGQWVSARIAAANPYDLLAVQPHPVQFPASK